MSTEKVPLLVIFHREGMEHDEELRVAWSGEEALEVAKSMLGHRTELIAGDELLVLWDRNATEALARVKVDLTMREPR